MAIRDEDFGAALTLVEGDEGVSSPPVVARSREPRDWQSLFEQAQARADQERARADAAEARAEELSQAEMAAHCKAGSLKWQLDKSRDKLKAAVEEVKEVRRTAKDALFLQSEVVRLEKLLSQAGVESGRRGTMMSLRMEVFWLREALQASEARKDTTGPVPAGALQALKAASAAAAGRDTTGPLLKENARLRKALERSQEQKDELTALRRKVAALRRSKRPAQMSPPPPSARLREVLERTRKQKDTNKALRQEVGSLNRETRRLERENRRLRRDLEPVQDLKRTVRRLSKEASLLRGALAGFYDQTDVIASLKKRVLHLEVALGNSAIRKEELEAKLAERPLLPAACRRVRDADKTIESLHEEIARQRKANARQDKKIAQLRKAKGRLSKKIRALRAGNARLEARIVQLRSSRAVLSKALYGSRSEKQKRSGTERKRGQQRGAPGHGRTQRPGLKEKKERRNPPKDARICSCCGKPYVVNGERSTHLIEIEVEACIRRILRTRWRRGCECPSSPLEVIAPPVARLFPGTPYGTSFWARFLFEHSVCLRPLSRIAGWMRDQGLAISPGTLADSQKRFVPLFEPVAAAILAHQNRAALRHADETGWRVQEFRDNGRSSRAWLWTSVSKDAVYFHIDPSRSAEVAKTLFGDTDCTVFVVCDRYSAYRKLARELDGKVILCFCWAHQRRTFIECAAGHARLARWCEGWIERIGEIYHLNDERLKHYDASREHQMPAFDAAQDELKKAVKRLFADAEAELADLPKKGRKAKALRSLLNHWEGLCVFVDHPQVPMDNNFAERALRGPVIGRRLSFGSNSEDGAKFTAIMYSVVGTLSMNSIDVLRWLEAWLDACAKNGGKPPDDLSPWLPWTMSEKRKREFTAPG